MAVRWRRSTRPRRPKRRYSSRRMRRFASRCGWWSSRVTPISLSSSAPRADRGVGRAAQLPVARVAVAQRRVVRHGARVDAVRGTHWKRRGVREPGRHEREADAADLAALGPERRRPRVGGAERLGEEERVGDVEPLGVHLAEHGAGLERRGRRRRVRPSPVSRSAAVDDRAQACRRRPARPQKATSSAAEASTIESFDRSPRAPSTATIGPTMQCSSVTVANGCRTIRLARAEQRAARRRGRGSSPGTSVQWRRTRCAAPASATSSITSGAPASTSPSSTTVVSGSIASRSWSPRVEQRPRAVRRPERW